MREKEKISLPIAIIGAGVAGLSCARILRKAGLPVRVFDKGRRLGGRLSTRRAEGFCFNHGAQYLRAKDPEFARLLMGMEHKGLVQEWKPRIHDLRGRKEYSGTEYFGTRKGSGRGGGGGRRSPRYVGVGSMRRIAEGLAEDLYVRLACRVGSLSQVRSGVKGAEACGWQLRSESGEDLGSFHHLVLTAPPPQSLALLSEDRDLLPGLGDIRHAPCLAALVGFKDGILLPFDAIRTDSLLAWAACSSDLSSSESRISGSPTKQYAWVLHGSESWSNDALEREPLAFAKELLQAFLSASSKVEASPSFLQGHRWRYAKTIQSLGEPYIYRPDLGLAYAGDGCLGAKVEAAYLSGSLLAKAILERFGVG